MTGRRDDEARPTNARPTKRDVPLARVTEQPAGTSPPAGLRGRQLEPGQGAPERYDPSQVELAALREAETLDPPQLSKRAAISERLDSAVSEPVPSPSPTPVSVEVPRVRSVPPLESYASVGSSGKTRSVHSGTLLSVGGVDPRAPTERRLEAPRMFLSQSEHEAHAYFKAKTVPPVQRPRPEPVATIEIAHIAEAAPSSAEATPPSAPQLRASPDVSGESGRRARLDAIEPDSSVPPAQRFTSAAPSVRPPAPSRPPASIEGARATPSTEPAPISDGSRPHADLSGFQSEEEGDPDFDLRGVPTDPEPLARRSRVASDPELRRPSYVPPATPVQSAQSAQRARSEAITLPALTPPVALAVSSVAAAEGHRASLTAIVAPPPVDSRKRWLPIAVSAGLIAFAIWLGLATRPEDVTPKAASAPPAVVPALPSAVGLPAAISAALPAALTSPVSPAPAKSAAPVAPAPSTAAALVSAQPQASARPADGARPAPNAAASMPSSGLAAPSASSAPPASPPRRSIY